MPTIMSQNVIRPEDIHKTENPIFISSAGTPPPSPRRASIDSHHGHERNTSDNVRNNKGLPTVQISTATTTPASPISKAKQKASPPPSIQTTSLDIPRSTLSKSYTSRSEPSSTSSPSPSSASSPGPSPSHSNTAGSTMSHIRRWTSSLGSSSKKDSGNNTSNNSPKGSSLKVRTIGPISAPQPLTTPAPYACTPLPYSDSPTASVSATIPLSLTSKAASFYLDTNSGLKASTKPATSCPDLPIWGPQASDFSEVSVPSAGVGMHSSGSAVYSSMGGGRYRTSWKDRLFSSAGKRHPHQHESRRTSTNSNEDDEFDWSLNQDTCVNVRRVTATTTAGATVKSSHRPKILISPPLTQPTLPANRKTVPIISTPLKSPTDNMFESDVFDPFKIAPKSKAVSLKRLRQLTSDATTRSILDTLAGRNADEEEKTATKVAASTQEDTDSETSSNSDSQEGAVMDFATSLCEGLRSDFVIPPSYFDQQNLSLDESYPRTPVENEKGEREGPPKGRMLVRSRSRASSIYSTSSDSSTDSTDSASSDSSDSSQSSPISGASFFSSMPSTTALAKPTLISSTFLNSSAIKIPTSLMTLLPNSTSPVRDRVSPSTTPPLTPPFELSNASRGLGQPLLVSTVSVPNDPRALTLKRLAYIHTLKKMREREKRPFRHAVLLHLLLLQLRKVGVSSGQCDEINDFYTNMWAAQFPARWDVASATMAMAAQQQQFRQKHQQKQRQPERNSQTRGHNQSSTVKSQRGKESKSKRSLVLSIHNRIQSTPNSAQPNNSSKENLSSWGESDVTTMQTALYPLPQFSTLSATTSFLKAKAPPLLRMPAYPLINLEKKPSPSASSAPATAVAPALVPPHKILSRPASSDSEDDDQSEDDATGSDKVVDRLTIHQVATPKVIIPKRTTGRKGLMYQQQQQLQQQLRQHLLQGDVMSSSAFLPGQQQQVLPSEEQSLLVIEQGQAWMQAQLLGKRPRYATSTYTTVLKNNSELVTKPLLASSPAAETQAAPTSNSWRPHLMMAPYVPSDDANGSKGTSSTTSGQVGLLTPPLSPLFRPTFTGATPLAMPTPVMGAVQSPVSYLPINTRPPQSYSYLPRTPSPASPSSSSPSSSSYTLPHAQNSHYPMGFLESQNGHTRKANLSRFSLDGARDIRKTTPRPALPSPPLSPTIESEVIMPSPTPFFASSEPRTGVVKAVSGHTRPQRAHSHRSENVFWTHKSPKDVRTRHSMDEARTSIRKQRFKANGLVGEESEEDVPLAQLVQRRISSDMLRSTA